MSDLATCFLLIGIVWGIIDLFCLIPTIISVFERGTYLSSLPEPTFLLPMSLKSRSTMNWFGCWVCSILLGILVPLTYTFQVIYWLFHLGSSK